jgi:hypothetical protein
MRQTSRVLEAFFSMLLLRWLLLRVLWLVGLSCVVLPFIAGDAWGQAAERFVLGAGGRSWRGGGDGIDPTVLVRLRSQTSEDTTNAPGEAIDFDGTPNWIAPLSFDPEVNAAGRVLAGGGIRLRNAFINLDIIAALENTLDGDHDTAFERKPTSFDPEPKLRNIIIELDLGTPLGIERVRFYPRDTVVETPSAPFSNDFMRGYELWRNPVLSADDAPDVLVARQVANQSAVVDIALAPSYTRLLKLRSLAAVPFEIDEIEVYATGYLRDAVYLSDIIDLGARAAVGPVRWVESPIGDELFSSLEVRLRTGQDETPLLYRQRLRDGDGRFSGEFSEVSPRQYYRLDSRDRAPLEEDTQGWSPWHSQANGSLPPAPMPRRYIQFRLDFSGGLFAARRVQRLQFDYLQPPLAEAVVAEVFPRLAAAEERATFRYAVRFFAGAGARGFDRLEVDTNVPAEDIRALTVDGVEREFSVDFVREQGFGLRFAPVRQDNAVLEFSFDLPIFRFGTTFSGRIFDSGSGAVPQALVAGNAQDFGPEDLRELSGLFVSIPQRQIGKLVGQIVLERRVFTPNGDGANERFGVLFNLLQLVRPAPVALEVYDLAGRRVATAFEEELGIGKVERFWDGRDLQGRLVPPGVYVWVLRVTADAFEERHSGTVGVVY